MAIRPFTFGMRLRENGKTVSVRAPKGSAGPFIVEDSQEGRQSRRREHASLTEAVKDTASAWRMRLN